MPQDNAARAEAGDEPQRSARRAEHTARVGNVEIAVWKNQGQNGEFFTASPPVIRYKDGTSGEFKGVGGGEKGYQFGGREGTTCAVTL